MTDQPSQPRTVTEHLSHPEAVTDQPSPSPAAQAAGLPLRVRRAGSDDIPALLEIVQAAYRGEGGWTTEAHLVRGHRADEAEVQGLIADPAVLLLVAEEPPVRDPSTAGDAGGTTGETNGTGGETSGRPRLLGCCYTRRDATDPARAELGLFAVAPSAQGRGVGGFLLEEHVARRAAEGVRTLELCVLQNRPELRAWYERRGFRATGGILPFPADPALLVEAHLQMESMERTIVGEARP